MKKLEEVLDKQTYFFYKRDKLNVIEIDERFKSFYFNPTLFKLKLHQGPTLLYLFWYVFSFGKYRIFYVVDEESESKEIVHYSNLLPKIFKYEFMEKDDWYIVNCYTDPLFRGKRLFPFALSNIGGKFKDRTVWVGAGVKNRPSQKGIERAGYVFVSRAYKTGFFGIYRLSS